MRRVPVTTCEATPHVGERLRPLGARRATGRVDTGRAHGRRRGRAVDDVRGVPRPVRPRRGRAARDSASAADDVVSWQLPTWTESAVLVGALCRLGAVQNPMLPIYRDARDLVHRHADARQLLITPSVWNNFDYAALAEQIAGENDGMHTLVADHWNPEGDPATLPARARGARRPAPPTRCAGSSTRRARPPPRRARSTPTARCAGDRLREDDARRGRPTTSRSLAFPFTHVGGIIIGCSRRCSPARPPCSWRRGPAGVDPGARPQARRDARQRRGRDPRRAPRREAKADPDAVPQDVRDFPSGGSAKPPQLHDELKAVLVGHRHDRGLRHDRGADRARDRHRRPPT